MPIKTNNYKKLKDVGLQAAITELKKEDSEISALKQRIFSKSLNSIRRDLENFTKREDWTNKVLSRSGKGRHSSEQRPSLRHKLAGRGDGPIYTGWNVDLTKKGSIKITNDKPHFETLLQGTKRHGYIIPRDPDAEDRKKLKFWSGPPLKWSGSTLTNKGWNFAKYVEHPGQWPKRKLFEKYFEEFLFTEPLNVNITEDVDKYVDRRIRMARQAVIDAMGS